MPDTKTSDETAAGSLDGSELVRIVQGGSMRRATAQEIADLGGGGGGGLYSQILSAVPTAANTGLGTWTNQGSSTVADRATGITIYPNTTNLAIRRKAVPSTPYKVRALIALNSAPTGTPAAGIGWYDGTNKLHLIYLIYNAGWKLAVDRWTSPTVFSADESGFPKAAIANPMWLGLEDDGTTVKFQSSYSGNDEDYITEFSVSKASGFLGSSGYAHIAFVAAGTAGAVSGTLMSYDEA